jgi:hypothetical protein
MVMASEIQEAPNNDSSNTGLQDIYQYKDTAPRVLNQVEDPPR